MAVTKKQIDKISHSVCDDIAGRTISFDGLVNLVELEIKKLKIKESIGVVCNKLLSKEITVPHSVRDN